MKALAACGAAMLVMTGAALIYLLPWDKSEGVADLRPVVTVLAAASVGVYFLAVRLVLRRAQPRHAVWLVLAVAAALRVPMLFAPPILSSDIYRYVWDGKVQDAGINPYLYVPADPTLAPLRDTAIYPHINRADYARTIYAPTAQAVFAAVARISPSMMAMKLAMALFELLAIVCAMRLLGLAGLPTERVLIYAWNPVAVWSFAMDGHVDAVAIGLLGLALLLRCQKREGWAGLLLGAAALVKFLPFAVGPALWRRGGWARLAAGTLVAIAALYACYAGAGRHVLGFLPAYGSEEGFENGHGIWLLAGLQTLGTLPSYASAVYGALVLLALGSLALWFMTRPGEPDTITVCHRAAVLAAAATAAIGPHYHWYFAWIALPAVIAPSRPVIWLSAAPVLLFVSPFDGSFTWACLLYVPALLLTFQALRPTLSPTKGMPQWPQRL
jgi:alpha-1,6-mannosyltransferase